ncbi:hypothetical protein O6H91_06G025400 [Diphasiastrum complanatum]|uniref:Uncharacterized protein n=4 Tax=Diphasiastrum complanatum TaxID=34168 RepID=A0ACC2DBQ6_DIPCM|nr:hypothetical protein O6H91_06G025400 [Diphasiastrum complanatum]KAJ7551704.1 hypothetical protein O6H91_06G025400 [Diphasiastrum complanatum]KAJ7551705.1 hypothetical protein O6H91_06G025400 [Diphasiastrum complanatum]KAJ7551706.1 hypothetical protein O6H91_06G025400 [Diphasiastrum complanatum]
MALAPSSSDPRLSSAASMALLSSSASSQAQLQFQTLPALQSHPSQLRGDVSGEGVNPLLYVSFNQDHTCFACGTHTGFRIYNCDPFRETFRREFDDESLLFPPNRSNFGAAGSGIGIVEMLFKSNISALVGGGKAPRYYPNRVMIWDDNQSRCIGELMFRSEVRAVKLRRDRLVVLLEYKIYVYNFMDLRVVHQIETLSNPKGLCALSSASNSCVLACPGLRGGEVRLELYSVKKTKFVQAHESALACMALSQDGSLLATASTKGTLIRIFRTADGTKLQELRRGADKAAIYSISFSSNCYWLAISSDKGTVHVFSVKSPLASSFDDGRGSNSAYEPGTMSSRLTSSISSSLLLAGSSLLSFASANTGSSLSFMKGVLPRYFSSEWSFAQFRLLEETRSIVAFGPQKNTIIIVCANGSYYRCAFDPVSGGEMVQQEFARFFKPAGEL